MCEVHKPEKMKGVEIKISNLSEEDLISLPDGGAFIETSHGNFIIEKKFYGDELVYLLLDLTRAGKLNWAVERKKSWSEFIETKYICNYNDLRIVLSETGAGGLNIVLSFDGSRDYCLIASRLTMQLYEEVTLLVDPANKPVYIKGFMDQKNAEMQANTAGRAIGELRLLLK